MEECKARWRVERRDEKREEALLRDFGVQLRWLREQRRMTLEEAEVRSGVSTSSLSAYERGEGNPTLRTVWGDRIFEKCGIRRDEGGDGGKTLEIRGKRRLSARDGGANYQQS